MPKALLSPRILLGLCLVGCSGAGAAAIGNGDPADVTSEPDAASPPTPPKQPHANDASTPDAEVADDAATPPPPPKDAGADVVVTPDCGAAPTLHPSPGEGVYCPFQAVGAPSKCAIDAHCCVYPAAAGKPATCNQAGVACEPVEGMADFACDEPADCPGGSNRMCCMKGTVEKDPTCYSFGKGVTGSRCRLDTCAAGEEQLCSGSGQCPAGKTCVPFATRGKELGACR